MVEVTELVNFANKLGYYWQKKGNNKPYFYEAIPLAGKRILTLEEMQQLYNTATTYDWIHKKYVPFFITLVLGGAQQCTHVKGRLNFASEI